MKGILKNKDGKWVVEFLQKLTNIDTWGKELPLHSKNVNEITNWETKYEKSFPFVEKEVEFEIVGFNHPDKFDQRYNDVNYAKLITPKQGSFDEDGFGITRVIDDKQEEIWMPSDLDDWGKIFYKYDVSKYNNNDITDFRNWLKENYHPPVKK